MSQQDKHLQSNLKEVVQQTNENKDLLKQEDYFQKVKAIYKSKTNRARYSRNSEYKSSASYHHTQDISNLIRQEENSQNVKKTYASGIDLLNKSSDQPSLLNKSKMVTEDISPKKKFFHNKLQKQKRFHNSVENDRMIKRLNEIKKRQNKYLKESQELIQFEKEHKMMHESSVIANRKLELMEREEQNDKFVDRLVERVKYKQTVKPTVAEKISKCVKLDDSRAKVALGSRVPVHLPPMVFD